MSDIKLERVGEKWTTIRCGDIIIIAYNNAKDCDIKFQDNTVLKKITYGNIKKGSVTNPNSLTAYGVGFIGQGKYTSKANKKITKPYDTWIGMLRRCYSEKFHIKQPTYKNCMTDEKWHNFQVFAEWFNKNYIDNFELDKDILFKGNKIYSPETCCFVPPKINSLFINCKSSRGKYPIGVTKVSEKFKSSLQLNGKLKHLGTFTTVEEAFKAYKTAKEQYIKEVAEKRKEQINPRVYQAMYNYNVEITD